MLKAIPSICISILFSFILQAQSGCPSCTVGVPAGGSRFAYEWDFGDGSAIFTGENPPPHVYDQTGTYAVSYHTTVDTADYTLESVRVLGVTCVDELGIGTPDLFVQIFEPNNGAKIFDSSPAINNTPLPHTFPVGMLLGSGNYILKVIDEDSGLKGSDDLCGTASFNLLSGDTILAGGLTVFLNILHPINWLAVPEDYNKPVINLVQGIRHADPRNPLFGFLQRPAAGICVSQEVADAITSTGKVNGPVFTTRNGLSTVGFPTPASERDIKVLIAGYKHPELAAQLATTFEADGIKVQCLTKQIVRHEYFSLVARASITVFLPYEREGFYLPALEGIALGTFVVCPECIGNRGFCFHEENCLRPPYDIHSIASSCREALARISSGSAMENLDGGFRQVKVHSLSEERRLFLEVLYSTVPKHC